MRSDSVPSITPPVGSPCINGSLLGSLSTFGSEEARETSKGDAHALKTMMQRSATMAATLKRYVQEGIVSIGSLFL